MWYHARAGIKKRTKKTKKSLSCALQISNQHEFKTNPQRLRFLCNAVGMVLDQRFGGWGPEIWGEFVCFLFGLFSVCNCKLIDKPAVMATFEKNPQKFDFWGEGVLEKLLWTSGPFPPVHLRLSVTQMPG